MRPDDVDVSEPRSAFVPPHSDEAEQSVLAAVLVEPACFDSVAGLLRPESFYSGRHAAIWSAMTALRAEGAGLDAVSLVEALRARGTLVFAGDREYIAALSVAVPSASHARRHAEIVAAKAAQRELIAAAGEALDIAREPSSDLGEKLDRIGARLAAVQRTQMRRAPIRLAEAVQRVLDQCDAMQRGEGEEVGWATGIGPLDDALAGGLRPGELYGIAARPGIGKSSVARTIAYRIARAGTPTLVLSMEMPIRQVAGALIAQFGRVDSMRIRSARLESEDWNRMLDFAEVSQDAPLWIDDEPGLTLAAIAGKARHVKGLKVLVVDYLQLAASTLKGATTNDQVAELSKGLKRIAMELGIAVVVLSQLNRQVEQRGDKEPVMADLRDSGAIEQDLDVAVLLWEVVKTADAQNRPIGWKVDKNRHGPKPRWLTYFDGARYEFQHAAETIEQVRARCALPAAGTRRRYD
ncbi:replicative DNA helicase [Rubrivivax benzoatilyticus]|uniref:DNA 5'-3' helicase n=1 Tax=Rubrivivax benzoatilyticus TaxID=316997 RepID=A0ABX0HQY4_9BURK|nr:replicative DNA helicase [Rubrivivax benzoatilyticus]EGJ11955.1 replicative DNA helicase [Rubrivivax benzoatilyticus JA2 = ATCC BAA-35]NHK97477.1 replicative DNA helicase [Rubrivivax benzoatilyticus]NHL22828.1 replicative DNA helicase [Rubrivivax benzoatilyticus]